MWRGRECELLAALVFVLAGCDGATRNAPNSGETHGPVVDGGSPGNGQTDGNGSPPDTAVPDTDVQGDTAQDADAQRNDGVLEAGLEDAVLQDASAEIRPLPDSCSSNGECSSGFCAQGVCCDKACQGACIACNMPSHVGVCSPASNGSRDPQGQCAVQAASTCGTTGLCDGAGGCRHYPATTICAAGSCTNGIGTGSGACDGNGSCIPGAAVSCLFGCNEIAGRCNAGCPSGDAICADGSYCSGDEQCQPRKASGRPCAGDHECVSAFCAQTVCCNTACAGPCFDCNLANTPGTCTRFRTPIPHGVADQPDRVCIIDARLRGPDSQLAPLRFSFGRSHCKTPS